MGDRGATAQQITIVGCVQRESEYREAHAGGRGGTLGTGIGAGNEFVLTNAMPSTASASGAASGTMASGAGTTATGTTATGTTATGTTAGTAGTTAGTATGSTAATGTSGMTASMGGKNYSLTGNREKELETYVGQKVEIVGTLDNAKSGSSGASTGYGSGTAATGATTGAATGATTGATTGAAGTTASAPASHDDLQALTIVSFRAVGGSCTAQ